jgi:UDP-N-acetylmuramoyl-tripeptide--D-alanyl-D-alanine ligase
LITLSAEEAARALGVAAFPTPVRRVSLDTRSLVPGDVFVALRGERTDGHQYVEEAFRRGAATAVVEQDWLESSPPLAGIVRVADTRRALGAFARAMREKSGCRVIAVTGSVGKTGTKDLIAGMASREKRVVATRANENNEVGVPLTLLRLESNTECAVLEMGMRGLGEIARLAEIAQPDVGVITAVAPVHLELLGSLESIAQAKAEIIEGLPGHGVGVIPAGVPLLEERLRGAAGRSVVRFCLNRSGVAPGTGQEAPGKGEAAHAEARGRASGGSIPGEVEVVGTLSAPEGSGPVFHVSWPGGRVSMPPPFRALHRLENVVCAAAACYAAGLPLETCLMGLGEIPLTGGRGEDHRVAGVVVIDDSYNANPVAVVGALGDLVAGCRAEGGRSVAVLGDMLELGGQAAAYHYRVGAFAARLGVECLCGVGSLSAHTVAGYSDQREGRAGAGTSLDGADMEDVVGRAMRSALARVADGGEPVRGRAALCATAEEGLDDIMQLVQEGDHVLVKGSRGMQLEVIVKSLLARLSSAGSDMRT